jgi:hypothetical protein
MQSTTVMQEGAVMQERTVVRTGTAYLIPDTKHWRVVRQTAIPIRATSRSPLQSFLWFIVIG